MLHVRFMLAVISVSSVLFADGFIISSSTYLTPLSVKYHKVTCTIDNGVATTTVDQEFVNNQDYALVNGRYVFPVPRGAAVGQFKIVVDGEEKVSTILSKEEARTFFTAAVKNSNQATLLEYTDNTAFTLEIGSVAPGVSRKIQLSYVEVLPKTDGLSKYLYPLNTERFSMQLIDTVSITVSIVNSTPITSVYAPSFPATLQRVDEKNVVATYTGTRSRPDRDFDLYYKLSDEDISFHLFPFKKEGEDGYFLMLITPKLKKPAEEDPVVAKDIVFTIDQSGSMGGTKITQARDALRFCINRLAPEDYFNIVAFETTVRSNAEELLPATAENISSVREFVDAIEAMGSTNISDALTTTLSRMDTATERPHYCIFLTDGQATAGETNAAKISQMVNEANASGTRIFSVGFGFDVNTILIDKLSIDNGGFPLYCSPDQNIEEVIGDLYKRIESPILTSPAISFDGTVPLKNVSPEKLADLFSGSEIAVYGRYKGEGTNVVTLKGNSGDEQQSLTYTANFPAASEAYPFVPRLWATQQIAALMTKIKLQTLTQDDLTPLVDSVKALSLAYGIVTPYTSSLFVAGGGTSWTGDLQRSTGGAANGASNYMQGMQQNSNAAQTVVADTNALPANVAPRLNQMQSVGNKIFVFTADSIWKDAALDSTVASDTVPYGSDEYFALAAQDADLRKILTVGNQAAFTFGGKNYVVVDNGSSGIRPRFGTVKAGAAAGVKFTVLQSGAGARFSRTSDRRDGSVGIYSVNGKRVAQLSFGASNTVTWTKRSHGGAAGTYLAVYREAGVELVKRFLVE